MTITPNEFVRRIRRILRPVRRHANVGIAQLRLAGIRVQVMAANLAKATGVLGRRPYFVVGSFNEQFEGNSLAFSRQAAGDPRIRFCAVTPNPAEAARMRRLGVRAVTRGGVSEAVALSLADAVFTVGHLYSDFSRLPALSAARVMFWHNTPMKAMGKVNKPIPDPIGFYDIVTATSSFTAGIMRDSFASTETRVLVTGHPKSDPLFLTGDRHQLLGSHIGPATRVISYLPTWRHDFGTVVSGDFGRDSTPLVAVLEAISADPSFTELLASDDALFVVKPHAWDDQDRLRALRPRLGSRVLLLEPNATETTDLLRCSDIVVTDYSGVLVDWLILAKPTVCYTFDYDDYWRHRGSPSFDYAALFRPLMVATVDELRNRLMSFLRDPDHLRLELATLSSVLHAHRDGNASARIIDHTLDYLRECAGSTKLVQLRSREAAAR